MIGGFQTSFFGHVRRITIRVLAVSAACASFVGILGAMPPALSVARLTNETYEAALACGRSGVDCAVTPYLLCPASNGPFSAHIATPFSRVAAAVYEAMKAGGSLKSVSPSEANYWGFGVYVFPNNNPRMADTIQKVIIRRGTEVIEPITTTIAPAVYRGPGNPPLSKGFFTFSMQAFLPTSDITFVLTGISGSVECYFDRTKLDALR